MSRVRGRAVWLKRVCRVKWWQQPPPPDQQQQHLQHTCCSECMHTAHFPKQNPFPTSHSHLKTSTLSSHGDRSAPHTYISPHSSTYRQQAAVLFTPAAAAAAAAAAKMAETLSDEQIAEVRVFLPHASRWRGWRGEARSGEKAGNGPDRKLLLAAPPSLSLLCCLNPTVWDTTTTYSSRRPLPSSTRMATVSSGGQVAGRGETQQHAKHTAWSSMQHNAPFLSFAQQSAQRARPGATTRFFKQHWISRSPMRP